MFNVTLKALVLCSGAALSGVGVTADVAFGQPGQVATAMLFDMAKSGDPDALAMLPDLVGEIDATDATGASALAYSVLNDDDALVAALLESGADPNIVNMYGVGPLILAIKKGELLTVQQLLRHHADPNVAMWNGETPLMHASRLGDPEMVKALISNGAEVNVRETRHGQTALMWAAAAGNADVTRLLLDAGADVALATPEVELVDHFSKGITTDVMLPAKRGGQTALMFAVSSEDTETVRVLLDAGSDANWRSADGTTATLMSVYHHKNPMPTYPYDTQVTADLSTLQLLLDRGADPNIGNVHGLTPLAATAFVALGHDMRGQKSNLPEYMTFAPRDEEAEAAASMLLAAGADPNIPIVDYRVAASRGVDHRGPTRITNVSPFLLATAFRKDGLVREMLDSGRVDMFSRRKNGDTPLMAAVRLNGLSTVKILVEAGADVNAVNDAGETPVLLASVAPWGGGEMLEYLLEQGGSLDVEDNSGETPFTLAYSPDLPVVFRAGLRLLDEEKVAAGIPIVYMARGMPRGGGMEGWLWASHATGLTGREYIRQNYPERFAAAEPTQEYVPYAPPATPEPAGDPLPFETQPLLASGQTMFDDEGNSIGIVELVEGGTVVVKGQNGDSLSFALGLIVPGGMGPTIDLDLVRRTSESGGG